MDKITAFDTYTQDEVKKGLRKPTLAREARRIGILPNEALYIGTAYDGCPILLDLDDDQSGHVIVYNQSPFPFRVIEAARRTFKIHGRKSIEFITISREDLIGDQGWQKILALVEWAQKGRETVVFIEDAELMLRQDLGCRQNLKWLLLKGAKRHLRIIANAKTELPDQWGRLFKTSIYETEDGNFAMKEGRKWVSFFIPEI